MDALLIAASPSARSRSAALLDGAAGALEQAGVAVRRLVLTELPAEALLRARTAEPLLREALDQVARAGAVVLATPIYKAAYSGLLKTFLDLLPQDGLHGKWIWPLATGGSPAHTLALDHSLRPVLDTWVRTRSCRRCMRSSRRSCGTTARGARSSTPTCNAASTSALRALRMRSSRRLICEGVTNECGSASFDVAPDLGRTRPTSTPVRPEVSKGS